MNDYQKCVLTVRARRDRSVILMIYLYFFQALFFKGSWMFKTLSIKSPTLLNMIVLNVFLYQEGYVVYSQNLSRLSSPLLMSKNKRLCQISDDLVKSICQVHTSSFH